MLAVTGLWEHHAQVLYVPAVLVGLILARASESVFPIRSLASVLALVSAGFLLAGSSPAVVARSALRAPSALSALGQLPDEAAGLLSVGESGTYARVGPTTMAGTLSGSASGVWCVPGSTSTHSIPRTSWTRLSRAFPGLMPSSYRRVASKTLEARRGTRTIRQVEMLLRTSYVCSPWGESKRICVRNEVRSTAGW